MSAQSPNPRHLSVHRLSAAIQARHLSPVELVETLLETIGRLDGKLHAFAALYSDDARLAAEGAEKAIRAGHSAGPLHGIPIALKDLIELDGRVTTGGSRVWNDRIAQRTATLVSKAKAAGMIVIGKTHLVEFAPTDAIVETAKKTKADLIVMGTRGLTGLRHVLLGSVAERTLRLAPCPVLTVKDEVS